MRRKSASTRKINRPRQLYQYKKLRERVIEEEKFIYLGVRRENAEKVSKKKVNSMKEWEK